MIPPEVYKNNIDWWAPVLAKVFTYINSTGIIPEGWRKSVIFPIFKKGDRSKPHNYRPISLLNISSKIYTRFLLWKLTSWWKKTTYFIKNKPALERATVQLIKFLF